jgi:predicted membrane channel-forming protein YqfA (hemolysin III family)
MSNTPHSHSHRKRIARIYLVGIFLLLAGAIALLFRFVFHSSELWRNFIGVLLGDALASILLLIGVWRRIGWSRYVLIGLNWLMLITFTLTAAFLGSDPQFGFHHTVVVFGPPLAAFVAANVWLIKSKRIRHLVTPPGSGG